MSYLPEIALMRGFRWVWYWNFSPSSLGEKNFLMGLFSPTRAFSGGFWQISLKRSLYVKNWKKSFLRPLFRATFPLNTDLNSSSGSLWDPLGPSGTPLGTPLGGPRGSQRTNLSWSSTGKLLGIKEGLFSDWKKSFKQSQIFLITQILQFFSLFSAQLVRPFVLGDRTRWESEEKPCLWICKQDKGKWKWRTY